MTSPPTPDSIRKREGNKGAIFKKMDVMAAKSALSWWQESGVDGVVGETPCDWLASAAARAAPLPLTRPIEPPADLSEFHAWLTRSSEVPLPAGCGARVGPDGDPASGLMVLVDMPTADDLAEGRLLAGEAGALFDRMLTAIRRSRETIYLASLSPARPASGRIAAADLQALAVVALHHVGLVAPKVLLLFGDLCSTALTGAPVAGSRGRRHEIATQARPVSTFVTLRPHKLLTQPALKRIAWEDLQMVEKELGQ